MDNNHISLSIKELAGLCATEVGRNIKALAGYCLDDLENAARALKVRKGEKVGIVTGFYIEHGNPPAAETDGPLGAVSLAGILNALGYSVVLITDELCRPALEIALKVSQIPVELKVCGIDKRDVLYLMNELQDLSCLISVERLAPSGDGRFYNMRGEDLTHVTAPLNLLFERMNCLTIGIGDGGNEIGMGKLPPFLVAQEIKNGAKVAAETPCDYLIVAGVSNWGAYALGAALTLLEEGDKAPFSPFLSAELAVEILRELCEKEAAVDGVSREVGFSVDGIEVAEHLTMLEKIRQVAGL